MVRPLQIAKIGGVEVEMLFTPSLYGISKRKGQVIEIEDSNDFSQVTNAYAKIMYLAALNAREVRQFDDPELPDLEISLMDITEWASSEPRKFGQMIAIAVEALTGEPLKVDEKDVKEAITPKNVKKKSFWAWITRK